MPMKLKDLDLCAEATANALNEYGLHEEWEALQAVRDRRRVSEVTQQEYRAEINLAWRAAQAFEFLPRRKG